MSSEFDIIQRHFCRPTPSADLGVGDDAALLRVRAGHQLVVSCDMLVEGTHFLPAADPESLGWKTLAVSVSDLAAMAAQPRWTTLALSLPAADERWLGAFSLGFHRCCDAFGVELIGGDTTRGPLNLCATLFGEVPAGAAVTRAGARAGDRLWVSGQPGRAALALAELLHNAPLAVAHRTEFAAALHRPQPRLALGLALRGLASAMLDVSDGLLGDLGHILERSGVGAVIDEAALPLARLSEACSAPARAMEALLCGGDDYELLFTAAPACDAAIQALAARCGLALHPIGAMTDEAGRLQLRAADGTLQDARPRGFDHFGA